MPTHEDYPWLRDERKRAEHRVRARPARDKPRRRVQIDATYVLLRLVLLGMVVGFIAAALRH